MQFHAFFFIPLSEVRERLLSLAMAKDGDIIDFLLESVFQLFGWILGGIANLFVTLVGASFSGIAGLFKKA